MIGSSQEFLIGVISDTHGRFPPQVATAFADVDLIIHAGDFNTNQMLAQFRDLGKLKAVRGNTDNQSDLVQLPKSLVVQVGEVFIFVIHDLLDMDINPQAAGFQVVIHGHLHVPECVDRRGVLYLNPGSPTSPRRGSKPGAALLRIRGDQVHGEIVSFDRARSS
jgi:putative phosphoesterase